MISNGYLQQVEDEEIWSHIFFKKHFLGNAYEVELLDGIHISPIFNIVELIEYHDDGIDEGLMLEPCLIPTLVKEEIDDILDSHMGQSTRNRQYEEYLVKWKG